MTRRRVIAIVPFGTLLSMHGWRFLASRGRLGRLSAIGMALLSAVHFKSFYHDYLTDYRRRSAPWFQYNVEPDGSQFFVVFAN